MDVYLVGSGIAQFYIEQLQNMRGSVIRHDDSAGFGVQLLVVVEPCTRRQWVTIGRDSNGHLLAT